MNIEQASHFLGQRPHCDARVLHAPGECEYCDHHKYEQALRILWRINFTGKKERGYFPCPSEIIRPVETINQWPGNRPKSIEEETAAPEPRTKTRRKSILRRILPWRI